MNRNDGPVNTLCLFSLTQIRSESASVASGHVRSASLSVVAAACKPLMAVHRLHCGTPWYSLTFSWAFVGSMNASVVNKEVQIRKSHQTTKATFFFLQ